MVFTFLELMEECSSLAVYQMATMGVNSRIRIDWPHRAISRPR
jgi:hypothetical protein